MTQPPPFPGPSSELAQASRQLEARIRALMAGRRLEEAIAGSRSVPEVLQAVCGTVREEVNADTCGLLLLTPAGDKLFLKAAAVRDAPLVYHRVPSASPWRRDAATGVPGQVLDEGRSVRVDTTVPAAGELPEVLAPADTQTLLCLPVAIDGSVLGVLTVASPLADALDTGDEVLLGAVCEKLGAALGDLRVFEDVQEVDAVLQEEVGRATEEQRRLNRALREEISARRRVEAELRQREQELQAQTLTLRELMAHLPEGVALLDEGGTLIVANDLARQHLEVLTGKPVITGAIVTHLGGRPVEAFLESPPDGAGHELVLDGPPPRTFEVTARPIAQGVMRGSRVLLLQDVTTQREVQERVHQQDRLAAVGQLAAGIAHDFNNVLTSVIGYAELLRVRDDVPEDARQDLSHISIQGERGAQMIRQILDFSRRTDAQRYPVGLKSLLKESLKVLGRALPETIRTTVDLGADEMLVDADPTQLQQVFTNLVVNARDAMAAGGVLRVGLGPLTVSATSTGPELEPGEWVVWTVADTGSGMSPEVRARIFEPFFTTKEPGRGTGLGLAQVYGIVQDHGGRIEVDSRMQVGTTFRIYLPRLLEAVPKPAPAETKVEKGRGETILVVEDQEAVRELAGAMLEALDYRVMTAPNGLRALEVYQAHRDQVDLVLTDAIMPEMGGTALIDALRQTDPEVCVLLMTGYPLGDRGGGNVPSGPVGLVEKPLDLGRLAAAVRAAIRAEVPGEAADR